MIQIHRDGGVAILAIDQIGRSMNVFDWDFARHLDEAVDAVARDATVTGVIVTSGKATFMAGADLAMMGDFVRPGVTLQTASEMIHRLGGAMRRLEKMGKPVVGASPGTALGGGFELLLACHWRIAADALGARYGLPEVTLGLLPGAGGTQRVPRLIGLAKAMPLLLEGRRLSTPEAKAAGLIDEVVAADDLLPSAVRALRNGRVRSVAPWDEKGFRIPGGDSAMVANGDLFLATNARLQAASRGNASAGKAIASCVYEGSRLPLDAALRVERQYFATLVTGREAQAMIRTLFFARQAADKLSRRPTGIPVAPVKRMGIVGAGLMGRGIAEVAVQTGIEVHLLDRDAGTSQAAVQALHANLDAAAAKGRLSADACASGKARLRAAVDVAGLAECDLVVEAVFEDRTLKVDILAQLDAILPPHVVLATNTSTLPISALASSTRRPHRVIGMHFFSPVPRMALVEVVVAKQTDDTTLAHALDLVRQLRKTPIVVNDAHGFYTSRCVEAYVRESLRLLSDGVPPAVVENAALSIGMPLGPLALADEAGLDVLWKIKESSKAAGGDSYVPDGSDRIFDAMKAGGRHGRKAEAGFYDYTAAGKRLWPGIASLVERQMDVSFEDVRQRLLYIQCVVASHAFDQGVVTNPGEGDLGAILGWAFPAHLGGPFSAMDDWGADAFTREAERLRAAYGNRFKPPAAMDRAATPAA